MSHQATSAQVQAVVDRVKEIGLRPEVSFGEDRAVIGVIGANAYAYREAFSHLPAIQEIVPITKPYKLASREFQPKDTVVDVSGVLVGGDEVVVMAGPCSVEGEEMLVETARHVAEQGARILRGGAFKPRTSPYSFQGLGKAGLEMLAQAREETGLRVVSEVLSASDVELVSAYVDMLQVGTRNMQNYTLLQEVGRCGKPVLLKRGMSATVEEWLLAAEYILSQGNRNVVLCERGIRTFEKFTRNTMDISAIPLIKQLSHLPIISDPSQGTGRRDLVIPMTLASIAAGTDALLIEVHPNPDEALKDGAQSLTLDQFQALMPQAQTVARAIGRTMITG